MKAEIFNFQCWLKHTGPKDLQSSLNLMLQESKYTILNFVEHYFENEGYTCIWLLAESHLALHTFPEEDKSYVELSGCNKEKTELFESIIQEKYLVEKVS